MKTSPRPEDMPAMLSDLQERVRRLEQARSLTVGPYVLTVDDDGRLVARHGGTGESVPVVSGGDDTQAATVVFCGTTSTTPSLEV